VLISECGVSTSEVFSTAFLKLIFTFFNDKAWTHFNDKPIRHLIEHFSVI
jgi:hypothetical protein